METMDRFTKKQEVVDFVSELTEDEALYYGNLIHSITQRPTSHKDMVEAKGKHCIEIESLNGVITQKDAELHKALAAHSKEIDKMRQEHSSEINSQNEKIVQTLAQKDAEMLTARNTHNKEAANMRTEYDSKFQSQERQIAELKAELKEARDASNKDIQLRVENNTRVRDLEAAIRAKDECITKMAQDIVNPIKEYTSELKTSAGKITFQQILLHTLTHYACVLTVKGRAGELQVGEALAMIDGLKVVDVAKTGSGHHGDFHVSFERSNIIIMVEVKNLKEGNPVPLKERERFVKDVDGTSKLGAGLLVSLNGSAHPEQDDLRPFSTPGGKHIMYLSKLRMMQGSEFFLQAALKNLLYLAETRNMTIDNATKITTRVDKQTSLLRAVRTNVISQIQKALDTLKSIVKTMEEDNESFYESIRRGPESGADEADNGEPSPAKQLKQELPKC